VITFDHVTFTYPDAPAPALRDVDLTIEEGELLLLVGRTGTGKSTFLGAINGLVPHFTGGVLQGSVTVAGRRTSDFPPRELADLVGGVGQAPAQGFVTDVVEDELAYTMENLGLDPAAMRRRVEDVLDLLDLHPLRRRPLRSLSSGQQQRVAIGSVLTASPKALVLDEPTSALDPGAGEEVLAALTRLVHDLGLTVVLAEHRLERVVQYADRIATIVDGRVTVTAPAEAMATAPVAPPVVELGRHVGWSPLPLSVRDARRAASGLRQELVESGTGPAAAPDPEVVDLRPSILAASGVVASYGSVRALNGVDLAVAPGEVVALMGRNGAGKSTLLHLCAGLRAPAGGRMSLAGDQPHRLKAKQLVQRIALVPADPGVLLNTESVAQELRDADRDAGLPEGATGALLDRLVPGVDRSLNPRDLSEGQRLGVALAVVLGPQPGVLLLDEPTRGLDYEAKAQLVVTLRALARDGHAIVLATHDVELVAEVASRAVVLADGDVVADGPARQVVSHSPIFAPQMAKVFAPLELLTVAEVEAALAAAGSA
jgi:energy-coupling factor transport system ATP-binding protein